jgi:uncharacterized protein DUF4377
MSHSCRAFVFAVSMAALMTAACSKQKAPESPAPEASVADAGAAAAPGAVLAPSSASSDAPVIETLFVRGPLADCQGEAPQKCLVVRGSEGEPWRNLYTPIGAFAHDPAFDYELRVEVTRIEGAPADAPSLRYHLVEIVSKRPAAP